MHIGFVGTSSISRWVVAAMGNVAGLEPAAVMSRSAARGEEFARVAAELAQVPQPRVVNTIEDLAGISDLDAVYIASPNGLHFDQARILIEAGKHVLIEKTITANAAQLETLLTLAKCRGVVVLEAMRSIHDPGFQRIRELLPSWAHCGARNFAYANSRAATPGCCQASSLRSSIPPSRQAR